MKVVLVAKKSTYAQMSENPLHQRFLHSPALKASKTVHERHVAAVASVKAVLTKLGVLHEFYDGLGYHVDTKGVDLVVTVGGDGAYLSTSHSVGKDTPMLGINSDPMTSVGHFCSVHFEEAPAILDRLVRGDTPPLLTKVQRMQLKIDGRVRHRRILNEVLFSHECPAATSKFALKKGSGSYQHFQCSGVWVGTGAGSTGALRAAGGWPFDMSERKLQAVIREPYFPAATARTQTQFEGGHIKILNKMNSASLHIDGPHSSLAVTLGQEVKFEISSEPLTLVGQKFGGQYRVF